MQFFGTGNSFDPRRSNLIVGVTLFARPQCLSGRAPSIVGRAAWRLKMHRACYVARELWPHVRIVLAGYRMPSQRPAPRHSLFFSDATGNYGPGLGHRGKRR
jgi:hypothetical protein